MPLCQSPSGSTRTPNTAAQRALPPMPVDGTRSALLLASFAAWNRQSLRRDGLRGDPWRWAVFDHHGAADGNRLAGHDEHRATSDAGWGAFAARGLSVSDVEPGERSCGVSANPAASTTCSTSARRPTAEQLRRPQKTGSDRAPAANIAPKARRLRGRTRPTTSAPANEASGAECPVPQRISTVGRRTSREAPMPKGSPATRRRTATDAPTRSTTISPAKSLLDRVTSVMVSEAQDHRRRRRRPAPAALASSARREPGRRAG